MAMEFPPNEFLVVRRTIYQLKHWLTDSGLQTHCEFKAPVSVATLNQTASSQWAGMSWRINLLTAIMMSEKASLNLALGKKLEDEQEIPTDKQSDIWKSLVCWTFSGLLRSWESFHAWCKTKQCFELIDWKKMHLALSGHVEICLFRSLAMPVQIGQVCQWGSLSFSWHFGLSLQQMNLCWSKTLVSSKHCWRSCFKVGNVPFSPLSIQSWERLWCREDSSS